VKTSVLLTSLCLGAFAPGAFAADVSIKGKVSETVDASDNYFLKDTSSGSTLRSLTAGKLDVLARTPTTQYLLDANYSYYKYFGPGAADAGGLVWGTPASATFRIDHTTELAKYNIAASWTRVDATQTQLTQSGVANLRGSINTFSANGGVTRDLGRNDSISWTANASKASYTDPNQFPYLDVTTVASWNHNLSRTNTLINSASFDWFSEDNPAESQRLFWKFLSGLESKISPRLKFTGHVGLGFVNSYQTGSAQPIIPSGSFQPQVGTGNGWLADIALNYDLLKTTSVSLTAAHTISPLVTGQLQLSDTVGLTLNHKINNASDLTFSTQFSYLPASSSSSFSSNQTSPSDFFTASVAYGYQLTREWRTNLSYTYRQRNDDFGLARSSTVTFVLSRDLNLLGNPTAINQAEQERARERAQQAVGEVFPTLP
jgi:hypothetical protein